jgi:transposase
MARHAYCGRRTVAELLERLRAAPRSAAGELEAEAQGECVRALVAVLRPLVAQIATLSAAVERAVDAHPDGKIVTSLFRKGRVCAATLLAEIGDDRARFVSGDHSLPRRRRACDPRVREAARGHVSLGLQHAPAPGARHTR